MKGYFKFGNPVINLNVKGRDIEMLLDTGFNGYIMLPKSMINKLALEQIGISDYLTASGQGKITNVYITRVRFFEDEIEVVVLSTDADFSLAGMELFHECRIVIEKYKDIVEVTKN